MPRDQMANPGCANRNVRLGGRSWVYFAQRGTLGPVKIGRTRQLSSRITALQSVCPEEVALLGQLPETDIAEARLHAEFRRHRIRGEWFHPAPEILELAAAGKRIYAAGYCHEIPDPLTEDWLLIQRYAGTLRRVGPRSPFDLVSDMLEKVLP